MRDYVREKKRDCGVIRTLQTCVATLSSPDTWGSPSLPTIRVCYRYKIREREKWGEREREREREREKKESWID